MSFLSPRHCEKMFSLSVIVVLPAHPMFHGAVGDGVPGQPGSLTVRFRSPSVILKVLS